MFCLVLAKHYQITVDSRTLQFLGFHQDKKLGALAMEILDGYLHPNQAAELKQEVAEALKKVEERIGAKFGDEKNPLLFSVRSGARASMPGMMDTVLNLGLNDKTVLGLADNSGNKRFAFDSYRRFIQMYSDVVLGVDHYNFEVILDEKKFASSLAPWIVLPRFRQAARLIVQIQGSFPVFRRRSSSRKTRNQKSHWHSCCT